MTTCSKCSNPSAPGILSYLGDPLCQECAEAEQGDGTDEARVEAWARENAQPNRVYYVLVDDCVYSVWPGDGRDWTAALIDEPLDDGLEIEEIIKCQP